MNITYDCALQVVVFFCYLLATLARNISGQSTAVERLVKTVIPPPIPANWTTITFERKEPAFGGGGGAAGIAINGPCNKGSGRDANGDCVDLF